LTGVRSVRAAFHNIYGPGAEKTWFFNPALSGGGALIDLGVHLLDLSLWLLRPHNVCLKEMNLSGAGSVENAASLLLMLDDMPFSLEVSWDAPLAATEISFEARTENDLLRWENVDGSFFHFRRLRNQEVIANKQTSLRGDTLRAFASALESRRSPRLDTRVYAILDSAYGRTGSSGCPAGEAPRSGGRPSTCGALPLGLDIGVPKGASVATPPGLHAVFQKLGCKATLRER
jgi:predicted dehydrogenase